MACAHVRISWSAGWRIHSKEITQKQIKTAGNFMDRDIFEDMKIETECAYISDLPYIKNTVEKKLFELPFDLYSKEQLQEFCDYVFRDNGAVYQSLMIKYRRNSRYN